MAYKRNNNRHQSRHHSDNKKYNKDFSKSPFSKCRHPSHVTVRPKPGEFPERTIKRFLKKVKKEKVLEIYREKTDYYKKPSVLRRRKAIRRQALLKKQRLQEQQHK